MTPSSESTRHLSSRPDRVLQWFHDFLKTLQPKEMWSLADFSLWSSEQGHGSISLVDLATALQQMTEEGILVMLQEHANANAGSVDHFVEWILSASVPEMGSELSPALAAILEDTRDATRKRLADVPNAESQNPPDAIPKGKGKRANLDPSRIACNPNKLRDLQEMIDYLKTQLSPNLRSINALLASLSPGERADAIRKLNLHEGIPMRGDKHLRFQPDSDRLILLTRRKDF